jgi:YesN/AraC family two-component response regulator
MMPVMDGMELYAALKNSDKHKSVPFVLLTAKADHDSKMEALTSGVDEYLIKPFVPRELLIRLQRLVHLKKSRKEGASEENIQEPAQEPSIQEAFLRKFRFFVEERIMEDNVKISDLCDALAVSERQLHYKIKAFTGATPAGLVREIKLRHARRLLEQQQVATASEAANAIGFENVYHFSKLFEQHFGKKPSSYFR